MTIDLMQSCYMHKKRPYADLSPNLAPSSDKIIDKKLNKDINERPFKYNSDELSFKGLSFCGDNEKNKNNETSRKTSFFDLKKNPSLAMLGFVMAAGLGMRMMPKFKDAGTYSISQFNDFTQKHIGSIGTDLLEHLKKNELAKEMISIDGDKISFKKKTVARLVWDGMKYPFTILPADMLNGSIALLRKFKPTKKWAEQKYETKFFKNIRQKSKIDAKVNALRGLFEKQKKLLEDIPATAETAARKRTDKELSDEMYRASMKMFNSRTGNYDTKHERALNRLVTGLPPAIFLANDAYNLSRLMDDDKKMAEKEQKTRFSQETARILSSGYLTLITFGALSKFINNSKFGIMLMTGSTVLVTEMFSRLANGKHITRLTPEAARQENIKNHAEEAKIKPVEFSSSEDKKLEKKKEEEKRQKPLLSFSTVMKASAVVIAAGFGLKGLRKIQAVDDLFVKAKKPFKQQYAKLTQIEDYKISKDKFDEIIKVLNENGFTELAEKYKETAKSITKDGMVNLGKKDKKVKPFVDFVIAPFKFAWNAVTMPFWILDEKLFPAIFKGYVKKKPSNIDKNVEALSRSINYIGKEALNKKLTPKQFKDYVRDNILKGFNEENISNVSNSELSNLAKFASTAATLWFLMTDNYNMVMLKSNGNDVDGANTKFKERFVQEGSRLFYQTLLIDLFNNTFRSQYNKSLFGMSWISLTNTTLGEILTRKSVGTPVMAHTRAELEAIETEQNNATGLKKGYYTFMKRLTGKRPIQSYNVANKEKPSQVQQQPAAVDFTKASSLRKMINA
ncbi:hypothetical protein J6E39_08345 [bacterium]|nr:hypothetical protein [bacterium]